MDAYCHTLLGTVFLPFVIFFIPTPFLLLMGTFVLPPALYFILLVPVGTGVWAGCEARRLQFEKYDLFMIRSWKSALLGCLGCWHVCFPAFLFNRRAVLREKVRRKSAFEPVRTNHALECLLAVQIVAVWAAGALPGRRPPPTHFNEDSAVEAGVEK